MKAEDVTHLFSKSFFNYLIEFNKKSSHLDILSTKKAIIDTNYLVQINAKDLSYLFFEKNYEEKITSPLKRQMAKLFRAHVRGEMFLFFSNSIFREFVYIAPKKIDLILLYNNYFGRIGSKQQFETFFLDLASLLNLGAKKKLKEKNPKVDLLDTYSYIIANLVGIGYFITENSDLKGIFNYVNEIKNSSHFEQIIEINKLIKLNEKLFGISEKKFPLKKILEYLFRSNERLTIPINIKDISQSLSTVSEKAESVIALCEMYNKIEEEKKNLEIEKQKEIEKNYPVIRKTKDLIYTLFESLDLDKPRERINIGHLFVNLIEKDGVWEKPEELNEIYQPLFQVLDDIYLLLYPEEEEPSYKNLEELFTDTLFDLEVEVKCKHDHQFTILIYYGGIVAGEPREMGTESYHVWNNEEIICSKCGKNNMHIELQVWEYPQGMLNHAEFESDCTVLNENKIYQKIGIIPYQEDKVKKVSEGKQSQLPF